MVFINRFNKYFNNKKSYQQNFIEKDIISTYYILLEFKNYFIQPLNSLLNFKFSNVLYGFLLK